MKARPTIPRKARRVEARSVNPIPKPTAQPEAEVTQIDSGAYPQLSYILDFVEDQTREPFSCRDHLLRGYQAAKALLQIAWLAELGQREAGEFDEPEFGYLMDAAALNLETMRLAGERLYKACEAKNGGKAPTPKTA